MYVQQPKANQKTFNSKLGIAWGKIGDINDPVTKGNFIRVQLLKEPDIYDKEGHTTLLLMEQEIQLKLFHVLVPQICGRIQDSNLQ